MVRCWQWLLLVLLALGSSVSWAQDPDADQPETEQTDGLEVVDLGVAEGHVRKPLELRYRRSLGLTWVSRGLLFLSEGAVFYAQYDQGTGFGLAPFFTPGLASAMALLSVYQMRRGLRDHELASVRPNWRLAGIITLIGGTATSWWFYQPENPWPAYGLLALSQLVGVVLIQTQSWIYRGQIRPGMWPFDRLGQGSEETTRRTWEPVIVPTRGGLLAGAALRF